MNAYHLLVKELFIEHHNCMGMDLIEAEDLFNETEFKQIEKWLLKVGYTFE